MTGNVYPLCAPQRGKKRHWKEAYHVSSDEVNTLHTKLLAKHKDLEGLEAHLGQLHTELQMLGINTGLSAAPQQQEQQRPGSRGKSKPSCRSIGACSTREVLPLLSAEQQHRYMCTFDSHPPTMLVAAGREGSRPASRGAGAPPASAPVDLAEARQVHAAAAEQLAQAQGQVSELDAQVEAIEADTQATMVSAFVESLNSC
jgi:hypothetical protein